MLLEKIQLSFVQYEDIYFNCIICGECCFWGLNIGVFLSDHDITRLSQLGPEIHRELNVPFDFIKGTLGTKKHGELYSCIFQGAKPGRCEVYYQRPFECRLYPLILDTTVDGGILLHLEHCPGITFRGSGINLIKNLEEFFRRYFEKEDFAHLAYLIRKKLEAKPKKIPILPDIRGTWISREKALQHVFSETFLSGVDLIDIPQRLIRIYNDWRKNTVGEEFKPRSISILEKKDETIYHPLRGRIGNIHRRVDAEEEVYRYLWLYGLELIYRERTFGFVHLYNITLDDEMSIYISALKDIITILQTKKMVDLEALEFALSLVDQQLEFYTRIANKHQS